MAKKKVLELRDLAAGQSYSVQVKAVDGDGEFISSGYSLTLNFTTDEDTVAPNAPSALSVDVEGANFVATWNPPTTNEDSTAIEDFKDFKVTVTDVEGSQSVVYYTTGSRFEFTEEMNKSAFGTFSQGIAGMPDRLRKEIQISVVSRDFAQNESAPAVDSAVNGAPGAVTLTDVTDGKPLAASIDWGQPTGGDILAYRVRRGTSSGVYDVDKVVYNTEYSTGGLSRGTYYFLVEAYDKFGNKTLSNEVTSEAVGFWESEQAVPDLPTISSVSSDFDIPSQTSDITFNITGPGTADSGAITNYDFHSHYEVRWSTSAVGPFQYQTIEEEDNSATHSVAINGLKPNTLYYYGVKSVSQYGRSGAYQTGSTTTAVDNIPPAAPANPSASGSLKNITAKWDANTESDLDYYELYASQTSGFTPGAGTKVYQGNGTGFAHSVDNGETWYFKVSATDKSDNTSPFSVQFSATSSNPLDEADTEPPSNVTGLSGTASTYYHGSSERAYVDLSWNAATDNVGVTGYFVAFRVVAGTWTELVSGTTDYRVGDLQPGVAYEFRVKAFDAEGNRSAAWSSAIQRTATSDSAATVGNVTLTGVTSDAPGALTASWNAVTNVPVRKYVVQVDDNAGFTSPVQFDVDGTRLFLNGVPSSTQYVRVKAVDEFSQQSVAWSNVLSETVRQVADADIEDGGITDLVKFGGDLRPPTSVVSLPALPNATYPTGALVVFNGELYRNDAGTWTKAVQTVDLDGQIINNQIQDGAVSTTKIVDSAVITSKLNDAAVTLGKVAANAVDSTKIVNNAVIESKLADAAVTLNKVATNAVDSTKIVNNSVIEAKIADAAVTLNKVAINSVNASKIVDGSIVETKLGDAAVTLNKVAANAVDSTKLVDNAVTESKLQDAAVTLNKVAANAIDTTKILNDAITTLKIANDAIVEAKIAADAISSGKIVDGAILEAKLADSAVTAGKLNVSIGGGNLLENSGFEDTSLSRVVPFFSGSFARSQDETKSGDWSLKVSSNAGDANEDGVIFKTDTIANTGDVFTVSCWIKSDSINPVDNLDIAVRWSVAATGAYHSQSTAVTYTLFTDKWVRLQATGVTPADGLRLDMAVWQVNDVNTLQKWYVDNVQMEEGDVATAYAPKPGEILPGTVTATEIADDSITSPKIVAGAVVAGKIAADAIGANEIQANSITAGEIAANAITADELAANSVIAGKIAANAVDTNQLTANAVTAAKIAANTITAAEIAASAITADELAANSVIAGKIAADAVTATEIAANTITAGEIAANAITASELAANSVTAAKIQASAVTTDKLNANAVTAAKIAADTITAAEIAASAITADELAANSVIAGKVAANAIDTDQLTANAVTAAKIAANTITASEIAALTITAGELAANSVVAGKIAANAVDTNQLTANAVTAAKIAANTITANEIAANAITASELAANSVIAAKILAGSVETDKLAANAVTAAKIAANTITAAEIAALTITAGELAANSVIADKIAANAITTTKLDANAVTAAKIAALTITANELAANSIVSDKITTNAITSAKILAGAVIADKIGASAVTTDKLQANAVTANKLNVVIGGGNLVPNSSFEDPDNPFTGWSLSQPTVTITASTDESKYGGTSVKFVGTGSGTSSSYIVSGYIPVDEGKTYTASGWLKRITPFTEPLRIILRFYDEFNVQLSTVDLVPTQAADDTWQRIIGSAVAPANAVTARLWPANSGSMPAGETAYFDAIQLEEGDYATAYSPKTDEILPGTIVANMIQADQIDVTHINTLDLTALNAKVSGRLQAGSIIVGSTTQYDSGYDPTTKEREVTKSATAPVSPLEGDLWIETDTTPQQLYRREGANWVAVGATSANDIGGEPARFEGTVAPGDTTVLWVDTSAVPNILKRYNGTSWEKMTPTTAAEVGTYDSSTIDNKDTTVQNNAASDATAKANAAQSNAETTAAGYSDAIEDAIRGDFGGSTTATTIDGGRIQTGTVDANVLVSDIAIVGGLRVQSLFELNSLGVIQTDNFNATTKEGMRIDHNSIEIYGNGGVNDVSIIIGGGSGLNMNQTTDQLWFGATTFAAASWRVDGTGAMRVGTDDNKFNVLATGELRIGGSTATAPTRITSAGLAEFRNIRVLSNTASTPNGTTVLNVGGQFTVVKNSDTTSTVNINGTLNLAGTQNVTGSVNINGGNLNVTTGDIINTGGTIKSSNFVAGTSGYRLGAGSGGGVLEATGAVISGELNVSSNSTFSGNVVVTTGTISDNAIPANGDWEINGDGSTRFSNITVDGGSFILGTGSGPQGGSFEVAAGIMYAEGANVQGTIKADDGYLNNLDITGLITATGASGRVEIDTAGVRLYDAPTAGALVVDLDAALGTASFKGEITATSGEIEGDLTVSGNLSISPGTGGPGLFQSRIPTGTSPDDRVEITGDSSTIDFWGATYDIFDAYVSTLKFGSLGSGPFIGARGILTNSYITRDILTAFGTFQVMNANETQYGKVYADSIHLNSDVYANTGFFDGKVLAGSGTVSAPSISFKGDTDTGVYSSGTNTIALTAGGVQVFRADSTNFVLESGSLRAQDGSLSAPMYTFESDTDTGMYLAAAGSLAFTVGGTLAWNINPSFNWVNQGGGQLINAAGTAAAPSYTFAGDSDSGFYSSGANDITWGVGNNTRVVTLDGSGEPGFRPGITNNSNLGNTNFRWVTVFSQNALNTSDEQTKSSIETTPLGLDFIKALEPIKFKRNDGTSGRDHHGFGANQVKEAVEAMGLTTKEFGGFADPAYEADRMDTLCPYCPDKEKADHPEAEKECADWHASQEAARNSPKMLDHNQFIAPLVKAVQELSARLEALESGS